MCLNDLAAGRTERIHFNPNAMGANVISIMDWEDNVITMAKSEEDYVNDAGRLEGTVKSEVE